MKKRKIKEVFKNVIQIPLRFHHQDLHQEINELKLQVSKLEGMIQVLIDRG